MSGIPAGTEAHSWSSTGCTIPTEQPIIGLDWSGTDGYKQGLRKTSKTYSSC